MKNQYIFFKTDDSFDYNGPFGDGTCQEYGVHGFEVEITKDDEIKIETLEGFGAFNDVENCKTIGELYQYIEENKDKVEDDANDEYETKMLLCELQMMILNQKSPKAQNGNKIVNLSRKLNKLTQSDFTVENLSKIYTEFYAM